MPSRYEEDRDGEIQMHERNNTDPDDGGCPHCAKQREGEGHKKGCPVERKRRHRRQDIGRGLKALFGGWL